MASETGRIELILSGNSRILAGVTGAVNHVAEAAGMKESARSDLIAAVEDACRLAFKETSNNGNRVRITLDQPPGKIEVVLEYKPLHAAGADSTADLSMRSKMDGVLRESTKSGTRLTLVKKVKR
ncbi:MAG TPA: hypothetical protein VFO34_08135 [Candidatus Acidoferrales bacterium]|nr:hypothetical protein [Candidatus Acidoferrales bacterium]